MVEPKATEDIKIEWLVLSEHNVRNPKNVAGIEDLKLSISMYGVLQPIIVMEIEEAKKYELIIGQRRYIACKALGMKKISARIYEKNSLKDQDKMILSFSENIQRRPIHKGDEIKAITELYDSLGSIDEVVKVLGISSTKVSESVNLDRFITPDVRDLLNIDLLNKSQLKAIIKITEGDKKKVDKAVKKALKIIKKGDYVGKQKTRAYETAAFEPDIPEDKLEEKVEAQRFEDRIFIDLPYECSKPLKQVAKETTGDVKDLILVIILDWLSERGLVKEK